MKSFNQFITEAKKLKKIPEPEVAEIPIIPCTNESSQFDAMKKAGEAAKANREKQQRLRDKADKDRAKLVQKRDSFQKKSMMQKASRGADVGSAAIIGAAKPTSTKYAAANKAQNARNKKVNQIKTRSDRYRNAGRTKE